MVTRAEKTLAAFLAKPKYCTTTRAAELIGGMSASTIYRAVQKGKIKSFRTPGGHYRVSVADVQAFARATRGAA